MIGLLIECGHVVMILIREAAPSPTFLGPGPLLRPPCPGLSAAHCTPGSGSDTGHTGEEMCGLQEKIKINMIRLLKV